jgi:hypothetical protein
MTSQSNEAALALPGLVGPASASVGAVPLGGGRMAAEAVGDDREGAGEVSCGLMPFASY